MTKKMFFLLLTMTALPFAVLYSQELGRVRPKPKCYNHLRGEKAMIFLNPDSCSYIAMTMAAHEDKAISVVLSEGKYTKNTNQIIFKDSRLGFIMVTEYIHYPDLLKYKTGYIFLIGNRMECLDAYERAAELLRRYWNEKWQQWEYPHARIKKLKNTPANKRLASGIYQNKYVFLRFRDNKTYDLYYTGSLISTGTWKQENSSITLEDKNLQCNFYMGLDENGRLRSVLLPGLYLPEEQYMIFNRIDKFPAGSGDVPYGPNDRHKIEINASTFDLE